MAPHSSTLVWIHSTNIHLASSIGQTGFPDGSDGKESPCNMGDLGLILGLGRSPEKRMATHFSISCLENSMDRGAW